MNEELIERYTNWLSRGWVYSIYYPEKEGWEKEINDKIQELIKLNDSYS